MIPNDFIQTLLARVDIVEVVDRLVPLKKAGANFAACCPFHTEKSPSFTVSPSKQFYHCFGCGAHGTAISFLMEYGGKPFPEAVEELARDVGLEVPRASAAVDVTRRDEAQDQGAALLQAARFYRAALKDSPRAIDYLKGRGLTGAIAARFGIGYATDDWQPLASAFPDYQDKALEICGLVLAGDGGKRYDRFRDRIMFPIHDSSGRVIGFGGRVLDKGEPKYLNSPETPLFSKGRELYGLFQARQAIRNAGRVIVVEGYMDVVALAQHGVEYAVATLGTATTPVHAQKLLRTTDNVVFCFDGDAAGKRAAWRALENTLPALSDGKNAQFLFLPDGDDPDDFIRRRGKSAFEACIDGATPLSDFLLAELAARHAPTSAEGRAALVNAAKPLVAAIAAPILGTLIRRKLAEIAGLGESDMSGLIPPSAAPAPVVRASATPRRPRAAPRSLVHRLIQCTLLAPELAKKFDIPKPAGNEAGVLAPLVDFCRNTEGVVTTQGIMQYFAGTTYEPVLVSALTDGEEFNLDRESLETELVESIRSYWINVHKHGRPDEIQAAPRIAMSREETERARQRDLVRHTGGA